jgi:hypothetical protein
VDRRELRRVFLIAALLPAAWLLAACAPRPRTELLVVVDSDLEVPDPLSRLTLSVRFGARELGPFTEVVDPSRREARALPISLAITDRTVGAGTLAITATASNRDGDVVAQTAEVAFVPGEGRALCLRLDLDCVGIVCPDAETCARGECVPEAVPADALLPVDASSIDSLDCLSSSHTEGAAP